MYSGVNFCGKNVCRNIIFTCGNLFLRIAGKIAKISCGSYGKLVCSKTGIVKQPSRVTAKDNNIAITTKQYATRVFPMLRTIKQPFCGE